MTQSYLLPRISLISVMALSGCGQSDISASLEQIREVQVDQYEQVSTSGTKPLNEKDVAVMVAAAKAMTTENGGILRDENGRPRMNVHIVPGDRMERADDGREMLDVSATVDGSPSYDRAVAKVMPEAPPEEAPPEIVPSEIAPSKIGRYIQVGSYSSQEGAQNAWNGLMQKGSVLGLRPHYQSVKTVSGKVLVRLKVGPVSSEAKAKALCDDLNIKDAWCLKAS